MDSKKTHKGNRNSENTADASKFLAELRTRETRLTAFFEGAPVPTFVIDENHRVRRWNRAMEVLSGIPAGVVLGTKDHWRAFYPDEQPCLADLLLEGDPALFPRWYEEKKIQPGLIDEAMEATDFFPSLGKSGKWLRFTASVIRDSLGKVLGAVETLEDITDRKNAEAALRDKEEKFRTLAEKMGDIVWTLDIELKTTYVSPSVKKVFGYTPEERMRQAPVDIMTPESFARVTKTLIFEMARDNEPDVDPDRVISIEVEYYHKDGRSVWMDNTIRGIRDESGRLAGIYGVSRDITDRKKAEAALRESEARFRLFSQMAPVGVVIEDHAEKNIYLSQKITKMLGYTKEDIQTAKDWWPLAFPDSEVRKAVRRDWAAQVDIAKKTNFEIAPFEAQVTCKDATVKDIEFRMRIADRLNFITLADITDRKQAESERAKLQAQFLQAQKMESVGRLAGGVAHDFNNMLSIILGHAELAMEQTDPAVPLYDDLQEIFQAAERSADLTRQLLAFARKQTIAPRIMDLNETVEGMLRMLRRLIDEHIDLIWKPAAHIWPVKMDPTQIDQILANLCVNAKDALPDGGKIVIETATRTLDASYCRDNPGFVPGDYVVLAVSDNGCGMSREIQANLFEPFFTTKDVGRGTGLGLATIYGIIKQNSGFINVYSEPEMGTTFKIYIPRQAPEMRAKQQKSAMPVEMRGHETILVVEDEAAILKMTRSMLKNMGYRVLTAETPAAAIRLAETSADKIHLLLTDVVMPAMNGRELAEKLMPLCPELKVLYISGYTANAIAHFGILDKGLQFIPKPFSAKDLQINVRRAIEEEREEKRRN